MLLYYFFSLFVCVCLYVCVLQVGHSTFYDLQPMHCLSSTRTFTSFLNFLRPVIQLVCVLMGASASALCASYLFIDKDLGYVRVHVLGLPRVDWGPGRRHGGWPGGVRVLVLSRCRTFRKYAHSTLMMLFMLLVWACCSV